MSNAEKVIEVFGGLTRMSKITGIPVSTIATWKSPKPKGSGGRIPDKHKLKLSVLALRLDLDILNEIKE